MKRILFFLFPIFISLGVIAQNFKIQLPPGYNKIYIESGPANNTEGSPYLNENWLPGIINLKNGDTIKNLSFRYNSLNDEMLYQFEGQSYIIITPDSIKELIISPKTFIYLNFNEGKQSRKGYFELIDKGDASFLIKYYIDIKKANYNEALCTGNKNDLLVLKEKYYLKIRDQFYSLGRKWETLTDVLSDKKTELDDFIQKEELKAKNKADISKVIYYYNSLK